MQMVPDIYWIDYRNASVFLKYQLKSGDAVVSLMPQTLEFYNRDSNGKYLQSYTDRQIFYDVSESSVNYLDKYVGNKVIRDINELKHALSDSRKVYIIAAPYQAFLEDNDNAVKKYIEENTKVVHEGYKTRIYVWER
jgi:hypothetical protein